MERADFNLVDSILNLLYKAEERTGKLSPEFTDRADVAEALVELCNLVDKFEDLQYELGMGLEFGQETA
jgi:hypothetical protein